MIKAFLPYLYTGAIVTATGGTGYLIAEKNGLLETNPPAQVALVQPDVKEELKPAIVEPVEEAAPEPEAVEAKPVLPTFSTLRVEQDGSTVIAGSGPENSKIEILNGAIVIAKTEAASNGDFVVVLDEPLKPGSYSLFIRALPPEGEETFSAEAGLINIPEPEKQEEVTVLVAETDKPTRILQKPEVPNVKEETVVVSNSDSASVPLVKEETEPVEEDAAVVEEPKEEAAVETQEVVEAKPAEPEKPQVPVLIEAADVEERKIFIAGTGEAGRSVNLYLNSKFLGTARVTKNNAFLFEGGQRLASGSYDLRADMIDTQTGKVLARAEVNLIHDPKVEPAPVETAAVTPEPEVKVEAEPAQPEVPKQETVEVKSETETETEIIEAEAPAEVETVVETKAPVEEVEVQKAEIRTGTSVIIRRGDSLWRVASRNYGEGVRYTTIFEANRDQVRNPNLIFPGQVLKVPENQEEASLQE